MTIQLKGIPLYNSIQLKNFKYILVYTKNTDYFESRKACSHFTPKNLPLAAHTGPALKLHKKRNLEVNVYEG